MDKKLACGMHLVRNVRAYGHTKKLLTLSYRLATTHLLFMASRMFCLRVVGSSCALSSVATRR